MTPETKRDLRAAVVGDARLAFGKGKSQEEWLEDSKERVFAKKLTSRELEAIASLVWGGFV